jgi:hypothetical protein
MWQAGEMPKGLPNRCARKKKFEEEIQQRWKALKPERVPCPSAGCECTYEMFGSKAANLAEHTAILRDRIEREHPDHTSEVLAVNEFRKRPR